MASSSPEPKWIFGFGSLISNPGFEHSETLQPCYIRGWRRVFNQGSTDHRGVPGAPGRTVTLEPCEGGVVWGAAFRLAGDAAQRAQTMAYLEWREKQYDLRAEVQVYAGGPHADVNTAAAAASEAAAPALTALTFIATADRSRNPNYLGPAAPAQVAAQIASARGPSGPNYEYLFRLADAMRRMAVVDQELFQLEALVRAHMLQSGCPDAAAAAAAQEQAAAAAAAAAQLQPKALLRGGSGAGRSSAGEEERSEATEVSVSSSV